MGCMCSCARRCVSKKKRRFREAGFDLDLTYITDRIIVMGFPSENCGAGQTCCEANFRNPMREVKSFLEERHMGHYKVFNFCAERCYDPEHFHGRVGRYGFLDHNCPSLKMVHEFCISAEDWLAQGSKHVVAIHCKAGKGRAGLMAVCLLTHLGMYDVEGSHRFYAGKRTSNSKGVTIPSQIRYTQYYELLLKRWKDANAAIPAGVPSVPFHVDVPKLKLKSLHMSSLASGKSYEPSFSTECFRGDNYDNPQERWSFAEACAKRGDALPKFGAEEIQLDASGHELFGDVRLTVYNKQSSYDLFTRFSGEFTAQKKMLTIWFNTAFAVLEHGTEKMGRVTRGTDGENIMVAFPKSDMDTAYKDKKCATFPSDFTITLEFEAPPQHVIDSVNGTLPMNAPEPQPRPRSPPARRQGTPPRPHDPQSTERSGLLAI